MKNYVKIEDRKQLDRLIETYDSNGWKASKPGLTALAADKSAYPLYIKHDDNYDWFDESELKDEDTRWGLDNLIRYHEAFNLSKKIYVRMHPEEVPGYKGWSMWFGPQINPYGGATVRVSDLINYYGGSIFDIMGLPIQVMQMHDDGENCSVVLCKINYIRPVQLRTISSYEEVGAKSEEANNYDEWYWEFNLDLHEDILDESQDSYLKFMFFRPDLPYADEFGYKISAFRDNKYMYYTNLI
jgi:hypothetical protein